MNLDGVFLLLIVVSKSWLFSSAMGRPHRRIQSREGHLIVPLAIRSLSNVSTARYLFGVMVSAENSTLQRLSMFGISRCAVHVLPWHEANRTAHLEWKKNT